VQCGAFNIRPDVRFDLGWVLGNDKWVFS